MKKGMFYKKKKQQMLDWKKKKIYKGLIDYHDNYCHHIPIFFTNFISMEVIFVRFVRYISLYFSSRQNILSYLFR